jgi:hypothetical protein
LFRFLTKAACGCSRRNPSLEKKKNVCSFHSRREESQPVLRTFRRNRSAPMVGRHKQLAHRSLFGPRVWDHGALVHGLTGVLIKNEIVAMGCGT